VTIFSIIILQLFELQIPIFLARFVLNRCFKTNLVKLRFSFHSQFAILEDFTLLLDPTAQLWVKAVTLQHFTCNARREAGRELVGY
jgi:hypothetical protein